MRPLLIFSGKISIRLLVLISISLNLVLYFNLYATSILLRHKLVDCSCKTNDSSSPSCPPNPHNYKAIHYPNDSFCNNNDDILLITFVTISLHMFEHRAFIRKTWGDRTLFPRTRVVFSLGATLNGSVMAKVRAESAYYNDILQEDFIDHYHNITIKTIMSFKWISRHCQQARFILRINDDVIVNIPTLIKFLDAINYTHTAVSNSFWCRVSRKHKPKRNPVFKNQVSIFDWPFQFYPDFCQGSAYLLTADLAPALCRLSEQMRPSIFSTFLEDVYVGMLAQHLNSTLISITSWYNKNLLYKYQQNKLYKLRIETTLFFYDEDIKNKLAYLRPMWTIIANASHIHI